MIIQYSRVLYRYINKFLVLFGLRISRLSYIKWPCWPENLYPVVSYEGDSSFHNLYESAQLITGMNESDNALRRMRHYTLLNIFNNTVNLKGDVVECGVFHGLSAYQIATKMSANCESKMFHIFDSFEGLSEIQEHDQSKNSAIKNQNLRAQFAYQETLVRGNLSDFDFIKYYKGWIPDRFDDIKKNIFSFVHIDVDLYDPIKASIDFFYPRLVSGGVMIFDDYGYTSQFPGAKKAIDESLLEIEYQFFLALPSGQAFLIK